MCAPAASSWFTPSTSVHVEGVQFWSHLLQKFHLEPMFRGWKVRGFTGWILQIRDARFEVRASIKFTEESGCEPPPLMRALTSALFVEQLVFTFHVRAPIHYAGRVTMRGGGLE